MNDESGKKTKHIPKMANVGFTLNWRENLESNKLKDHKIGPVGAGRSSGLHLRNNIRK